ncbi:hypothetical protein PROFUN_12597 [Planoprotostelium fungivorum]|uniref:Uncharacterized protein n=1 Tax=Planoprotostelium fungivorum TaxID=1890364 RepID=A0A2P6N686_9EUKA|nr:hypothetical protein PROFUN_12597 [Planoprotostelium fungivorum]
MEVVSTPSNGLKRQRRQRFSTATDRLWSSDLHVNDCHKELFNCQQHPSRPDGSSSFDFSLPQLLIHIKEMLRVLLFVSLFAFCLSLNGTRDYQLTFSAGNLSEEGFKNLIGNLLHIGAAEVSTTDYHKSEDNPRTYSTQLSFNNQSGVQQLTLFSQSVDAQKAGGRDPFAVAAVSVNTSSIIVLTFEEITLNELPEAKIEPNAGIDTGLQWGMAAIVLGAAILIIIIALIIDNHYRSKKPEYSVVARTTRLCLGKDDSVGYLFLTPSCHTTQPTPTCHMEMPCSLHTDETTLVE